MFSWCNSYIVDRDNSIKRVFKYLYLDLSNQSQKTNFLAGLSRVKRQTSKVKLDIRPGNVLKSSLESRSLISSLSGRYKIVLTINHGINKL